MVLFPNAKINLGLRITEKRKDGFHNIETIFIPVGLCDVLEFVENKGSDADITVTGLEFEHKSGDNLVVKAWELMNKKYGIPGVDIQLQKNIPLGAGLGGGSADAAFMLKGLNWWFNLNCSNESLELMAAQLGSDCAFFIRNSAAYATGRGEILETIHLHLHKYKVFLVNPGIHIDTSEAYAGTIPQSFNKTLKQLSALSVDEWQDQITNQFEESVFEKYPQLSEIKKTLLDEGAVYASMSGSGSTIYGLFHRDKKLPGDLFKYHFTWFGDMMSTI
ncbi:MAG: 4-(cytidine 5'-diphospho)-2-C-methyl-D-erythritol kinase [Bacteroidales bacterium]|nr:4-(cytidine 5'-diphospho)-2-C-methyl-D-erythritol kinase [Bacteroidales bacterium]